MKPGVWDIQNGTEEFNIAFWGVTPQAQNTFTSSSNKGLGASPQSGSKIFKMPILLGLLICTGFPWAQWKDLQILITLSPWLF